MRTIEVKLYKYDELSEDSKENALKSLWDVNVDHGWWESTYEDAGHVGIKIKGFDIDRGSYCKIEFLNGAIDVAEDILKEHGNQCDTWKTARSFLDDYRRAERLFDSIGENDGFDFIYEDDAHEMIEEFKKNVAEDYRIILQNEYEYLTSEEAIAESLRANEYEFDENGKRA